MTSSSLHLCCPCSAQIGFQFQEFLFWKNALESGTWVHLVLGVFTGKNEREIERLVKFSTLLLWLLNLKNSAQFFGRHLLCAVTVLSSGDLALSKIGRVLLHGTWILVLANHPQIRKEEVMIRVKIRGMIVTDQGIWGKASSKRGVLRLLSQWHHGAGHDQGGRVC